MKQQVIRKIGLTALTVIGLAACSTPPTRNTTAMDPEGNPTVMSHPTINTKYNEAEEKRGFVQQFIMSPRGQVDGFILNDGTQINTPAQIGTQLTRLVKAKDEVIVRGYYENDKVFKAELIKNARTHKVIGNLLSPPPAPLNDDMSQEMNSARTSVGANPARINMRDRKGLKQLSAEGTVETKIYGPMGEVNGLVLSDGSVVRFGPDLVDQTTASPEIGDSIKVMGYGTKNSRGQAIEATSLTNKY